MKKILLTTMLLSGMTTCVVASDFLGLTLNGNISDYKDRTFGNQTDDGHGYKYDYFRPNIGVLNRFSVSTSLHGKIVMIMAYSNPLGKSCQDELDAIYYGFSKKHGQMKKVSSRVTNGHYYSRYSENLSISMMCTGYGGKPLHIQIYDPKTSSKAVKEKKLYNQKKKKEKLNAKREQLEGQYKF